MISPTLSRAARGRRPSALVDLARLLPKDGLGLYASGADLFSNAIFGRDSAMAADYLLRLRPDVARGVILKLAQLQGTRLAAAGPESNEEEPGKIHHEHRRLYVDGRRVRHRSARILQQLSAIWGGEKTSLTYYGSTDATPLFVRTAVRYCKHRGDAILGEPVVRRDGTRVTVRDSVLAAVDWITGKLDESPIGLVEFQRRNPSGIPFQVWKDSGTSYLHLDATIANWDAPIAALEVQAYAYDALIGAAHLFGDSQLAAGWRERAQALRGNIFKCFWMPGAGYFAMGLDRNASGTPRWIESIASNAALLLDTSIFDGLPDAEEYIEAVARRVTGPEFLTEAGIRCRSLNEEELVDFQDYHGTWTVWMKETFDATRGLYRQGLPALASQLAVRLLNAVNTAGAHVEFLYVSPDQRVMYDFRGRDPRSSQATEIVATNVPEQPLAWTLSAALALKWLLGSKRDLYAPVDWSGPRSSRPQLDARLLRDTPRLPLLSSVDEFASAYERRGDFVLNRALGHERDLAARARHRTRA